MSSRESYGMWAGFSAVLVAVFMMAWVIRGDIAGNAAAISELRGAVSANAAAIAANNAAISELRNAVAANTAAIAELRGEVSANTAAISELRGALLAHIGGHSHGVQVAVVEDETAAAQ